MAANSSTIRFRCPQCNARIKAPIELLGENKKCPGCNCPVVVRRVPLQDSEAMLVMFEDDSGLAYRTKK